MGKLDPISGHCRHIDPAFIKQRKESPPSLDPLIIISLDGSCNLCQAYNDPKHLAFPLCFSTAPPAACRTASSFLCIINKVY